MSYGVLKRRVCVRNVFIVVGVTIVFCFAYSEYYYIEVSDDSLELTDDCDDICQMFSHDAVVNRFLEKRKVSINKKNKPIFFIFFYGPPTLLETTPQNKFNKAKVPVLHLFNVLGALDLLHFLGFTV